MGFKFISVAVLVAVFGASAVQAQSAGKLGGPVNPPPAGFTGQQFVDNRGCVFLKAGYGGQTSWVPRVGRDRKAMCGYPPTGSTRGAIEVASAAEMAVKPEGMAEPVVVAKPAPVAAAKPVVVAPVVVAAQPVAVPVPARQPAPYAKAAPVVGYEVAATGPGPGQIGCYSSAPVAERVKLRNGGTAVVCTRGDGSLTGWRPPIYPQGAGVGAALSGPVQVARGNSGGAQGGYVEGSAAASDAVPTPPKGYKLAWKDDRLNPNRGKGTAQGWADQAQVWTNEVPARLVAGQPAARKTVVVYSTKGAAKGAKVTVSTKGQAVEDLSAPQKKVRAAAAGGAAYVQVGTFGVPANAEGAAARLSGLGLPVARSKISRGGQAMQIVLAGPFASVADAQTALSMARGAGFGDAFLR